MDLKSALFFFGIPYFAVLVGLLFAWQTTRYKMVDEEQVLSLIAVIAWPISLLVIASAIAYDKIERGIAARSK